MVINISVNKTLDDSVIVKKVSILWFSYSCSRGFSQVIIKKQILTDQNECTQMRIDFDYKGFHKSWTLQIKIDAYW